MDLNCNDIETSNLKLYRFIIKIFSPNYYLNTYTLVSISIVIFYSLNVYEARAYTCMYIHPISSTFCACTLPLDCWWILVIIHYPYSCYLVYSTPYLCRTTDIRTKIYTRIEKPNAKQHPMDFEKSNHFCVYLTFE